MDEEREQANYIEWGERTSYYNWWGERISYIIIEEVRDQAKIIKNE